jgi:hypothetical protein
MWKVEKRAKKLEFELSFANLGLNHDLETNFLEKKSSGRELKSS